MPPLAIVVYALKMRERNSTTCTAGLLTVASKVNKVWNSAIHASRVASKSCGSSKLAYLIRSVEQKHLSHFRTTL